MTEFGHVNKCGEAYFWGSATSQIFWDPYLHANGLTYSNKIGMVAHVAYECISRGQPCLSP